MAGIYIHIPFCKTRCTYCDFYSEVRPKYIPQLVRALVSEIEIRKDYLNNESVSSIYFGGGTPSLLSADQFSEIFSALYLHQTIQKDAEITFEANPDDLTPDFFQKTAHLPFNRISIGIQSFDNSELKQISRRHNAQQAIGAVKNAQEAGFRNISIDLIYGLPSQTPEKWKEQIDIAISLNVPHISAYGLTYEEGTKLWKQRQKGGITVVDDLSMNQMYELLTEKMMASNYERYEISNFALPGFRSKHNSSYWKQQAYLGLGPSAHSYNLHTRQWNVDSLEKYIQAIEANTAFYDHEVLSLNEKYNEYVMVALRTSEGIDLDYVENEFGVDFVGFCQKNAQPFLESSTLNLTRNKICLTTAGIMISNQILIQLMKV